MARGGESSLGSAAASERRARLGRSVTPLAEAGVPQRTLSLSREKVLDRQRRGVSSIRTSSNATPSQEAASNTPVNVLSREDSIKALYGKTPDQLQAEETSQHARTVADRIAKKEKGADLSTKDTEVEAAGVDQLRPTNEPASKAEADAPAAVAVSVGAEDTTAQQAAVLDALHEEQNGVGATVDASPLSRLDRDVKGNVIKGSRKGTAGGDNGDGGDGDGQEGKKKKKRQGGRRRLGDWATYNSDEPASLDTATEPSGSPAAPEVLPEATPPVEVVNAFSEATANMSADQRTKFLQALDARRTGLEADLAAAGDDQRPVLQERINRLTALRGYMDGGIIPTGLANRDEVRVFLNAAASEFPQRARAAAPTETVATGTTEAVAEREAVPVSETIESPPVVSAEDRLEATVKTLNEMGADERSEMLTGVADERTELQRQLEAGDLTQDDFDRRDGTLQELLDAETERQRRFGPEPASSEAAPEQSAIDAQIQIIDDLLATDLPPEDRAVLTHAREKLRPTVVTTEPVVAASSGTGEPVVAAASPEPPPAVVSGADAVAGEAPLSPTETPLDENALEQKQRMEFNRKMQAIGRKLEVGGMSEEDRRVIARELDDVIGEEAARREGISPTADVTPDQTAQILRTALFLNGQQRGFAGDTPLGAELDKQRDFFVSALENPSGTVGTPTVPEASPLVPPTLAEPATNESGVDVAQVADAVDKLIPPAGRQGFVDAMAERAEQLRQEAAVAAAPGSPEPPPAPETAFEIEVAGIKGRLAEQLQRQASLDPSSPDAQQVRDAIQELTTELEQSFSIQAESIVNNELMNNGQLRAGDAGDPSMRFKYERAINAEEYKQLEAAAAAETDPQLKEALVTLRDEVKQRNPEWEGATKPTEPMSELHLDADGLVDRDFTVREQLRNRYRDALRAPAGPERDALIAAIRGDLIHQVEEQLREQGRFLGPATGDPATDQVEQAAYYRDQRNALTGMYAREQQNNPNSVLLPLIDQLGNEVAINIRQAEGGQPVERPRQGLLDRIRGFTQATRARFGRGGPRDPNRPDNNGIHGPSPEDLATLPQNTGEVEPVDITEQRERRRKRLAAAAAVLGMGVAGAGVGTQIDFGRNPAEVRPALAGQDTAGGESQAAGVNVNVDVPAFATQGDGTQVIVPGDGTGNINIQVPDQVAPEVAATTAVGGESGAVATPEAGVTDVEPATTETAPAAESTPEATTTVESTASSSTQQEINEFVDKHTKDLTIEEGSSISDATIKAGIVKDANEYNEKFFAGDLELKPELTIEQRRDAAKPLLGSYIAAYSDLLASNPNLPPLAETVKAFDTANDTASQNAVVAQIRTAMNTVDAGAEITVMDSVESANIIADAAITALNADTTGDAWVTFNEEYANAFNNSGEGSSETQTIAPASGQTETASTGDGSEVVSEQTVEKVRQEQVIKGMQALADKGLIPQAQVETVKMAFAAENAKHGEVLHGHTDTHKKDKTAEDGVEAKKDDDEELPIVPGGPSSGTPGEVVEGQ